MEKGYYSSTIEKFKNEPTDSVLGKLLINDEFETTDKQKNSWRKEIEILKKQLLFVDDGDIIFEFTIPRIGHRVDVVIIINGIICLLEFKVGDDEYRKSAEDQVMDYALDLKYFHEASKNKYIIPIVVSTEASNVSSEISIMNDNISKVLYCNKTNIGNTIFKIINELPACKLDMEDWIQSRYAPTPTIIEAAQALYRNHTVDDISRNEAGAENLTKTTSTINGIIEECKREKKKAICFVTGVPGAGKTLAGLNIANGRHKYESDEHAVFLSGNGPLVDVLQESLAKDKANREKINIEKAKRETKAFIQIIHRFRDEALTDDAPPVEKVVIFDEAQRAWDKNRLSDSMKQKKGMHNFEQSEPEFLISIMDRHKDWAVIVCLVGGGQEIYKGEAGIEDWFGALKNGNHNWNIYLSDKMSDYEYLGNSTIDELLNGRQYHIISELHLGVSLRSFRSEYLSGFVKTLLDNKKEEASILYQNLSKTYPIVLTRNLDSAKNWVRSTARGTERYGLLASSEGKRLRGIGVWAPSQIDHVGWFLNAKNHVNSSFYLEVAASEFKVQGLEIDYGLLAWDADLRYEENDFEYYRFRGTQWQHINNEIKKRYLKNAYRVLMTRARQGLVIFIPLGDPEDDTRKNEYYDNTYAFLKSIGLKEI